MLAEKQCTQRWHTPVCMMMEAKSSRGQSRVPRNKLLLVAAAIIHGFLHTTTTA